MNPKNPKRQPELNKSLVYKAQTRWLFHSHIKIKIPVFCDESLFDELYDVLENIDKRYNSYSADSYFDLINKNAGEFVEVDDETVNILKQIQFLSHFFDGRYDITVMPLIRLWGFYKAENARIPSLAEIDEAKQNVDYRKIDIVGNSVRIAENQEIITGSFIKAYAVDKLVDKMRSLNITDAVINAGGSTIGTVNNKVHPYWTVKVTYPLDKARHLFDLSLSNSCYSTSAQSKTYVEINGKRYSHIIDPLTGFPSENKQVGIVTGNCFVGDVISTGLFNLTLDEFSEKMEIISREIPVSGFLMNKDDNIRFAGDFERYIIE